MKTKSLGELLSDAEDKSYGSSIPWKTLSPGLRKEYQESAELFLNACGATPMLHEALSRMICAAVAARTVETTSPAIASKAAKALRSKRTGKAGKSIAASALTQTRNR